MCLGTKHIHEKRVLHRDLKSKVKKTAAMYSVRVSVLHIFMLYEVNVFPHLTCLHIHITCKGTEGEKLLLK